MNKEECNFLGRTSEISSRGLFAVKIKLHGATEVPGLFETIAVLPQKSFAVRINTVARGIFAAAPVKSVSNVPSRGEERNIVVAGPRGIRVAEENK